MPLEETFGGESPDEALAKTTNTSLSTNVADEPEFDPSDIDVPRLNIAQKTSDAVPGRPGEISIDKAHVVYPAEIKIPVAVVSVRKYWKEDIPYGNPEKPQFANTQAAADELEANSEYKVIKVADFVLLMLRTPDCPLADEDALEAFPYEAGPHQFALVKMTAQKFGYDTTFKRVNTMAKLNAGKDITNAVWHFSSLKKTSPQHTWYIPNLVATREVLPAEVAAFLANLKGGADE